MNASIDRTTVVGLTIIATCVLIVGALAGSAAAQALERDLYVSVLTPAGVPATDLTASEFLVREDGMSREVLRSVPATDPLQLALVVDNSAAAESEIPYIRDSLTAFVRALTIDYELALITVGDRPTIMCDYTSARSQIDKAIGGVFHRDGGGAYVMEALVEVSRGLQKREATRPVIIVVTTEGPELSDRHEDSVLDALKDSGAMLNVLLLTQRGANTLSENARVRGVVFDEGSRTSGGRNDFLITAQALPDRMRAVAAELSKQYKVTYARPGTLIPPESVTVAVTRGGHVARGNPVRIPKKGV